MVAASIILLTPVFAGEWQPIGPFGGSVQSIALAGDSTSGQLLLAGGRNGLLFRSAGRSIGDRALIQATNWSQLTFGTPVFGTVKTLAIDQTNLQHYWAGVAGERVGDAGAADSGLWESEDAGAHWHRVPDLAGLAIESFAVWRKDPKVALAGTRYGVYRTINGKNWIRISPAGNPELQDITAVAFDTGDAAVIYAGTPHLPWKTSDGGAHWRSARAGMLDDSDVFSLYVDPAKPQLVFASACSGIYRSENGGAVWKLLDGIPGTSRRTHVIMQDPRRPQVMYAGTTMGLFKSWNGGVRWNRLNGLQVNSIAFDAADSRVLYLATEHGGVVVTRDGGETLGPMNSGLLSRNISAVAGWSGAPPGRLYVSTAYEGMQGGVFRALLGSAFTNTTLPPEWQRIGVAADFGGRNVTSLATSTKEVFAAAGDRVYRYVEAPAKAATQAHWTSLPPPVNGGEVRALRVLGDASLLAATSNGLKRMTKGGSRWEDIPVNEGIGGLVGEMTGPVAAIHVASFADSDYILLRTPTGTFASVDSGRHWRQWQIPPEAGAVYTIASGCGNRVLVATSRGLFHAEIKADQDPALRPALGIPEGTVSTVAVYPGRCATAYAAQFGKTYISEDGGARWSLLTEGGERDITQLLVIRLSPGQLFAAVAGQGMLVQKINPFPPVAGTF
jgi:photosystem II stability/assembly factor-like uncharacterized protein